MIHSQSHFRSQTYRNIFDTLPCVSQKVLRETETAIMRLSRRKFVLSSGKSLDESMTSLF